MLCKSCGQFVKATIWGFLKGDKLITPLHYNCYKKVKKENNI